MIEITSYQEIKAISFSCYWRGCRDHRAYNWTSEQIYTWTHNELENSFSLPIENLMLEVIFFVLTSGSQGTLSEYYKKSAYRIITEINLLHELACLPPDDATEFKSDLETLGFINHETWDTL
ncbi:DUF2591 domain-containing protein [Pseudomonas serbica]